MLTFIHCLINDRVWIQDPFCFNDLASGLSLTRRKDALQWDKDGAMTQPPTFSRRLPPPPAWQVKKACLSGSWIKNQVDWSSQDAGKFSADKCLARPSPRPGARTRRHPEEQLRAHGGLHTRKEHKETEEGFTDGTEEKKRKGRREREGGDWDRYPISLSQSKSSVDRAAPTGKGSLLGLLRSVKSGERLEERRLCLYFCVHKRTGVMQK